MMECQLGEQTSRACIAELAANTMTEARVDITMQDSETHDGEWSDQELQDGQSHESEEIRALRAELNEQKKRVAELEALNGPRIEMCADAVPGEQSRVASEERFRPEMELLQNDSRSQANRRESQQRISGYSSRRPSLIAGGPFHTRSSESESEGEREQLHGRTSGTQINEYLKFVALPDVLPYSGMDKDYSFESFRKAFELKYPEEHWTDKERCALFKAKLTGKARTQYEALPREKRRGTYNVLTSAMKEMCKTESRNRKVVALSELRRLQKQESQAVVDFCVELERLTRRAYPELDEEALSVIRADQLYEQLSHWDESCHLQEALEGPSADIYERLKEAAMRVERRHISLRNRSLRLPPKTRYGDKRRTDESRLHRLESNGSGARKTEELTTSASELQQEKAVKRGAARLRCFN
ncbi:hypothetical protein ANCCAN_06498 [Ancylostoma caninum]|uniref:Uncharacterized protein n=1 Tax=Ancylostoma caninum TaxID=29170 RepID=A0A368GWT9_ANCCA|nr:hypothetical protein ANCCAN_06498 [Ancylostoma caninum]